jgi:hypothetical protein
LDEKGDKLFMELIVGTTHDTMDILLVEKKIQNNLLRAEIINPMSLGPLAKNRKEVELEKKKEEESRLMTHKYRGCIVVLLINKSVEPNEEQKVLMSGFDQGFTVNTSKQVFRGIW